jgi:hypothetical protein
MTSLTIYEPRWLEGQRPAEPPFTTFECASFCCTQWREFRLLVEIYRRGLVSSVGKTGLLSRKFELKARVKPDAFAQFAADHEDADVCMVNAFPMVPYLAHDVWMHAEGYHPGITERAQAWVDAAGLGFDLASSPRHTPEVTCTCNFWVATPAVWKAFVGGILEPMAQYLERHPDSSVTRRVLEIADYLEPVPFLPFIAERMFTNVLASTSGLKIAQYPLSKTAATDYCLTEFTRTAVSGLLPAVEQADMSKAYPEYLKDQQRLICRLAGIYSRTYYSQYQHPFSAPDANN